MARLVCNPVFTLALLVALVAGTPAGCKKSVEPDFESAFPQDRFAAIAEARRTNDSAAVRPLIAQLASDDPLVRLAAHDTLLQITGEDQGYDPAGPRHEREAGILRWLAWYDETADDAGAPRETAP